jgi:hypothetical protein
MQEWCQLLSPPGRDILKGTAPGPLLEMASRGLAPLPPVDVVVSLVFLAGSPDEHLQGNAVAALKALPSKIVMSVLNELSGRELGDSAMTWVDALARLSVEHGFDYLENLVVYPHVSSQALEQVTSKLPLAALELVAMDFRRLAATPELAFLLHGAPNANAALKAKVEEWAERQGIPLNEFIAVAPPIVDVSGAAAEDDELHIEIDDSEDEDELPAAASGFITEEDELEGSARQIPLARLLRDMSAAQKIALALKGNREARTALIRDSNRMISSAVLKNPRITDREILSAAQNRASSDEVVRLICANRDAIKNYQIRHALVSHPKTPLQTAIRFMKTLRQSDIKHLAKSKSISSALVNQAKKLVKK